MLHFVLLWRSFDAIRRHSGQFCVRLLPVAAGCQLLASCVLASRRLSPQLLVVSLQSSAAGLLLCNPFSEMHRTHSMLKHVFVAEFASELLVGRIKYVHEPGAPDIRR